MHAPFRPRPDEGHLYQGDHNLIDTTGQIFTCSTFHWGNLSRFALAANNFKHKAERDTSQALKAFQVFTLFFNTQFLNLAYIKILLGGFMSKVYILSDKRRWALKSGAVMLQTATGASDSQSKPWVKSQRVKHRLDSLTNQHLMGFDRGSTAVY